MLGHLGVFEPARRRGVSCVQEHKLFTSPPPPLLLQRAGKPCNPRFGEGGGGSEEELLVTRQPLCHLPWHAKISNLPLEAAFTRYAAAFKGLLSRIRVENKTITETQLNRVVLGKRVWCVYVAFSLLWERGKVLLLRRCWALLKCPGAESNSATTDVFQSLLHWKICYVSGVFFTLGSGSKSSSMSGEDARWLFS